MLSLLVFNYWWSCIITVRVYSWIHNCRVKHLVLDDLKYFNISKLMILMYAWIYEADYGIKLWIMIHFPIPLGEVSPTLNSGRGKIFYSRSCEKFVFYHPSCWSELSSRVYHPHHWMWVDRHRSRDLWINRRPRWLLRHWLYFQLWQDFYT